MNHESAQRKTAESPVKNPETDAEEGNLDVKSESPESVPEFLENGDVNYPTYFRKGQEDIKEGDLVQTPQDKEKIRALANTPHSEQAENMGGEPAAESFVGGSDVNYPDDFRKTPAGDTGDLVQNPQDRGRIRAL